jgi:hypothetical protein
VLTKFHSVSKWRRRRLKKNELLQLYNISDSVLKKLNKESSVTLLNVQVLTPLKMLHRGIETLFSVLLGGEVLIDRKVQMLKGNVPAILSLRVSQADQADLCLGRSTEVSTEVVGIGNEATC